MLDMSTTDNGLTRLIFMVPARGMIGYTTEFMSMTRGYGIINHTFEEFRPRVKAQIGVDVMVRLSQWTKVKQLHTLSSI